jgi:hypothetical protein
LYVKELRTSVHGRNLIGLLSSVVLTFLLFSSSYSEWIEMVEYSHQMSEFFMFLASLLWLTVLTFDAWWSIR